MFPGRIVKSFFMLSAYYSIYTVSEPRYWLLRDEPHAVVRFHVCHGDYFSTLATILRFYEETLEAGTDTPEMHALKLATVKEVIADLRYLDRHFKIVPKRSLDRGLSKLKC